MRIADFNRLFETVLNRLPTKSRNAIINFWERAPTIDPLTEEHGIPPFIYVVKGSKSVREALPDNPVFFELDFDFLVTAPEKVVADRIELQLDRVLGHSQLAGESLARAKSGARRSLVEESAISTRSFAVRSKVISARHPLTVEQHHRLLRAAAFHEAAHVAFCACLGISNIIDSVELNPRNDYDSLVEDGHGEVKFKGADALLSSAGRSGIGVLMVGGAAANRVAEKPDPKWYRSEFWELKWKPVRGSDLCEAMRIARASFANSTHGDAALAPLGALRLVLRDIRWTEAALDHTGFWTAVEALAAVLVRRKQLSGHEAEEIAAKTIEPYPNICRELYALSWTSPTS